MLDEIDDVVDNAPIEDARNVQISDVEIDGVGFKDANSALVTLKQFLEQKHIDVTLLIHSNRTLKKEIRSWCAQ